MDPFVRKLVLRLFDEGAPLSRNRHFHTFESPEGKQALRISRRLRALQGDLQQCRATGAPVVVTKQDGGVKLELHLAHLKTTRMTLLDEAEFELLAMLPGVREALRPQGPQAV